VTLFAQYWNVTVHTFMRLMLGHACALTTSHSYLPSSAAESMTVWRQ